MATTELLTPVLAGLAAASPVAAGAPRAGSILVGLLGGLALFLFGMGQLSDALKSAAGDGLRKILSRLTHNRFFALFTGAVVTAVIQSSSVTTVLVVGFVSAGLMSLAESVGVILGANIGTTFTAQIIAFKVSRLALVLVAVGFTLATFARRHRLRHYGTALFGLGLVFLGMTTMGEAMAPLRSHPPFLELMVRLTHPALGILVGALFTALVQSSSATTGIVIVLAGQGLLTLPAGIALTLGANVGTCVTALLATLGKSREARRAAMVHVLFNGLGVLLWLPFISYLAEAVVYLSPTAPAHLSAAERLAAETPRQIANAHTLFNVVNAMLFLGFTHRLARLAKRLVPDRPSPQTQEIRPLYLDPTLLETPSLALHQVRLELVHLGEHVQRMLEDALPTVLDGDSEGLDALEKSDDTVDVVHGHIVAYLGEISRETQETDETEEVLQLLEVANSLENIGDIVETNLVGLGRQRLTEGLVVSPSTRALLEKFHRATLIALEASLAATVEQDADAVLQVVVMKKQVNRLADQAATHQAHRLVAEEPHRLATYTLETDLFGNLKRVYYFTKRVARASVPPDAPEDSPGAALG